MKHFLDELRIDGIIPVYKKKNVTDKINYWPISLLPIISKRFEKTLYSQLKLVTKEIFSPKFCGFRKWYSSKNCLDTSGVLGTVLMDLS